MWTSWKFWTVWASILGLIALFAFGFTTDPKKVPSPLIGNPAPDFEVTALSGVEKIRLSELKGKPVLLNYWASWCQECKVEAPVLEAFHQKYGSATEQIKVVGIAIQDTPVNAKAFAQRFGKSYFLGLDDYAGNIALDYGIYGVPETFFIDPEGTIFYKHIGAVTDELLEKKFKPFL
ncbi:MAG: redoxin domain-containing protein [SAR324 cluster bacterium]|jgi:cytochrome c biogenesis protein CcmG/thiol:disulfide interchange protein DsbE|nr:redoxin domain-containing protein [SAR324 cluster bacterium]